MNVSRLSDLNDSQEKNLKQLWSIGNKHLVAIDESIIQKLGIDDNDTVFLEQIFSQEDNSILMRVKKIDLSEKIEND